MNEKIKEHFLQRQDFLDFANWLADNCELFEGEFEHNHNTWTPENIVDIYMIHLKNA